jgi:hypothetical protein
MGSCILVQNYGSKLFLFSYCVMVSFNLTCILHKGKHAKKRTLLDREVVNMVNWVSSVLIKFQIYQK